MTNIWYKYLLIFIFAGALSYILTRLYLPLAKKIGLVDHPDNGQRKIHTQIIPLAGGWPLFLSIFFVFLLGQRFLPITGHLPAHYWWAIVGATMLLVLFGMLDDRYHLAAKYSILGPILAATMVVAAGIKISYVTNPRGGVFYLEQWFARDLGWGGLALLITFLWILGMTYTSKLLDGIDGLSSSIGLIAALVIFFVSLSWDVSGSATSLLALCVAGSLFGFLWLNWHPAKVFLGEGGSTLIGFLLGILAIISGSKIATALLVMGVPMIDIIWVMYTRWSHHQPIWRGDQRHLHFRLLNRGFKQRQVVMIMSILSIMFGAVTFFSQSYIKIIAILILSVFTLGLQFFLSKNHHEKNSI